MLRSITFIRVLNFNNFPVKEQRSKRTTIDKKEQRSTTKDNDRQQRTTVDNKEQRLTTKNNDRKQSAIHNN